MLRVMLKGAVLVALLTPLASCQTRGGDECKIFLPISAASLDTRETQNQVAVHNAKGVAACRWAAP
jgi:hypothetical protein